MVEGLAWRRGAHGGRGSVVARLRYGFRLLPLAMLAVVWGLWLVALFLFCTGPAWGGRVPGELATYQLLNRGSAVLAAFSATLCGAVDTDGDGQRLLQGLPFGGTRLWRDRLALALAALLLADATGLAAARIYLPLPLGSALGALLPATALLAAVGFCAGGFGGGWIGLGTVLTYSLLGITGILAAQQPLRTPYWRMDPFLATQPPFVPDLLRTNRCILAAAAAGLGMFSAHAWSGPDRWGAWRRVFRRGAAGMRMATAGWVAAGVLAAAAVWILARPAIQRGPVRLPVPVGSVRVAGPATVSVTADGGRWWAAVNVPVSVPALLTGLTVSLPAASVRVDGRRLLPSGRSPRGWLFAGRALGWARGPATLQIDLGVHTPTVGAEPAWPRLRIDGSALEALRVDWPAGATAAPTGAVACGPDLCWSGTASDLARTAMAEQRGAGA